jgi:phosphoglycolate phosphatase
MVGDSAGDVLTGKNAGGASIGVLWGYGDRAELLEAEADAYVSDMKELMRELLARTKI